MLDDGIQVGDLTPLYAFFFPVLEGRERSIGHALTSFGSASPSVDLAMIPDRR